MSFDAAAIYASYCRFAIVARPGCRSAYCVSS